MAEAPPRRLVVSPALEAARARAAAAREAQRVAAEAAAARIFELREAEAQRIREAQAQAAAAREDAADAARARVATQMAREAARREQEAVIADAERARVAREAREARAAFLAREQERREDAWLAERRAAERPAADAARREQERRDGEFLAAAIARERGGVAPGARAMEIHNAAKNISTKYDELISILESDLGKDDIAKYGNIEDYLEHTIGNYIKTSKNFNRNNSKAQYISDFNKVKTKIIAYALSKIFMEKNAYMIGKIIDLVFKYNLEECFTKGFVYDCSHAYPIGTPAFEDGVSCGGGILERVPLTLRSCILSKNGGVFDDLKRFFGVKLNVSFNNLGRNLKGAYFQDWNDALRAWLELNIDKEDELKAMPMAERNKLVIDFVKQNFKNSHNGNEIPDGVLTHLAKRDLDKEFWSSNFGIIEGGRRKTRSVRKSRKSRKVNRYR